VILSLGFSVTGTAGLPTSAKRPSMSETAKAVFPYKTEQNTLTSPFFDSTEKSAGAKIGGDPARAVSGCAVPIFYAEKIN